MVEIKLEKCAVSGCNELEDEEMLAADLSLCKKHGEQFWKEYFEEISKLPPCDCHNCKHRCKK